MGQELVGQDADLKSRVTFMEHDLFNPQEVKADIYFFRHVLHDWPDGECIKMIWAFLPAIKGGSHVLVSEGVLPQRSVSRTALLEDMHVL